MKKYFILFLMGLMSMAAARAQEYKVNKSTGKIILNLPSATVEGYNGNEIVFSSEKSETEDDPRAKGLRAINGAGNIDNTGLGISVTEKGTTVEVNEVASNLQIKVLVPKGMIVSYACHSVNSGKVFFKNMENEIEISTDYNAVDLENVTGPVTVRSVYGSVDARFREPVKGPIAIASIYSTVDVAIPLATKANLKLNSGHGSIMASADLKIELEKNDKDENMINFSNNVNGKLNGGGGELALTSEYGKIYLRTAK